MATALLCRHSSSRLSNRRMEGATTITHRPNNSSTSRSLRNSSSTTTTRPPHTKMEEATLRPLANTRNPPFKLPWPQASLLALLRALLATEDRLSKGSSSSLGLVDLHLVGCR